MQGRLSDPHSANFLTGGGEMGERIRLLDWSKTPLGPVDEWPQSLRSAVSILLPSKAQIALFWGPELITLYNDAYRPVFGQKHPQALSQPVREAWSELWRTGLKELFENVLATGEAFWARDRPFYMERHGYPEETFFDVSYDPVRDESNRVGGVFCIVSETTARVIGERRLTVLRDLGVVATRAHTANEAWVLCAGVLSSATLDVPFTDVDLEDRSGWPLGLHEVSALRQCMAIAPGPWPEPAHRVMVLPLMERPEGIGKIALGVSARLPFDDDYRVFFQLVAGQITASLATARAGQAERQRAEALAEIDRAKTAFFSNVSHEFRTPLTLMLSPVEELLAKGHADLSPSAKGQLELVNRNGLRLLRLVNSVLDFSRIEAGRMQATYEATDLATLTVELASCFRSATEQARLELTVDCPPLSQPVYLDRDMWEKIVLNLISNAFKFTFEGKIVVSLKEDVASAQGHVVELRVKDTGVGIPAEAIPHLFERFYRGDNRRSRTHEGSGIGLALVQEFVKLHGGSVCAESTIGQGSTFIVTIPCGTAHLPTDRIGSPCCHPSSARGVIPFVEEALRWLPDEKNMAWAGESGKQEQPREEDTGDILELHTWDTSSVDSLTVDQMPLATRPRILVVDDNADMRQYVTRLLAERYRVEATTDGEAALHIIQARRPDLIVSDIMMPRLDGFGLLRALRNNPITQTIPVILLSARAGEESRFEGLEHGADDYLIKPFSARELLARVEAHVKIQRVRMKAHASLRESEERFRALTRATFDVVYRMSPDWTEMRHLQGRAFLADTLEASHTWLEKYIHPDDQLLVMEAINRAIQTKNVFELEHQIIREDSTLGWIYSRAVPILDEQGEIVEWFGAARDVTPRKQAEKALRESEERLQSILNHAPAAIFIKDRAGRYLFMNDECARVLRVNREQALGHTDRDFLSPELAAHFMANDQRVWESGQLRTVEERVPQADGVHISLVQKFLLRDSEGRPYALSGIALDITPHLQLEAAIQASEARLQLAQSAANIGVFDWDVVAQTGVWSPELERVWGLPVGGFDGTVEAWLRLVHPDDRPSAHAGIRGSLEGPTKAAEFEYRIVRPDGAVRWIYAKAKTLCDAEGHAVRMVGVNLDITDRKEAQLRLERFADELEQQVASRTHELVRSQDRLRALATELSLTEQRERKRLATELHDHLQQLLVLGKLTIGQGKRVAAGVSAYEQILKKVDDILSDALTYTRTLVSDLSPTVLRDHGLAAAFQWLGTYMQKHNLTVTVTVQDKREAELPEEDQGILLFQSVRELLINSAKHAGTGQATLTMEQREGTLCITVSDEGKGFDLAVAVGIPSGGISSKYGLYSIQERMRALGGSFDIHSAPGQGTTATLIVPLARKGNDTRLQLQMAGTRDFSRSRLSTHASALRQRVSVLLVDDHAMVRQGLRAVLDAYTNIELVGEAANGEEAVRLVDQQHPMVVVMDINMPKMNGIEATGQIKLRHPETIVIGLSVNAAKESEEAMKRAGAIQLMTKEAAVEQLYDVIHAAVKEREKRR
jgi:PAS domain S-box-containing protein